MNRDLHFSASVYGFGAGLFFIGYALFEIPSNLLLLRFGAKRWLARIMFTWGLLAAAMMFVRTPLEFNILRFLLGIAEAGFFPGVIYYLTLWFPAGQRARAVSRFYIAFHSAPWSWAHSPDGCSASAATSGCRAGNGFFWWRSCRRRCSAW